jgi:hypothetical protein
MTIIKLKPLNPDSKRLDWLEKTHHVIWFDSGEWGCAWRGPEQPPGGWYDWQEHGVADTIRGAIDAAIKTVEEE